MAGGGKRAVAVWHRRAGKDSLAINWTAFAAHQRKGVYWHMLPEAKQARKVIWDGIDREGRRIIDQALPEAIRDGSRNDEMSMHLKCGSIWQCVGSDNYNSLVGANPVGVVFSEYSVAKPAAWDFIRPILRENGGWAIFIYTPRGMNWGKKLYDQASALQAEGADWFAERLTVDDTGIITPEMIEEERRSGMSEELIQQEFYCSWEGSFEGAYYSKELSDARKSGRISTVPYVQGIPVNTFWDLGLNDTTAIWFHQYVGYQHRFIGCYESSGEPMSHYARHLLNQPYVYGRHFLPHDAGVRRIGLHNIKSVKEMLQEAMPGHQFEIVPRVHDVTAGIQQTRDKFSQCAFDAKGCEAGLNALSAYRKEWDEANACWRNKPLHDWSSNYADAFRSFGQGWKDPDIEFRPNVSVWRPYDSGAGY